MESKVTRPNPFQGKHLLVCFNVVDCVEENNFRILLTKLLRPAKTRIRSSLSPSDWGCAKASLPSNYVTYIFIFFSGKQVNFQILLLLFCVLDRRACVLSFYDVRRPQSPPPQVPFCLFFSEPYDMRGVWETSFVNLQNIPCSKARCENQPLKNDLSVPIFEYYDYLLNPTKKKANRSQQSERTRKPNEISHICCLLFNGD